MKSATKVNMVKRKGEHASPFLSPFEDRTKHFENPFKIIEKWAIERHAKTQNIHLGPNSFLAIM